MLSKAEKKAKKQAAKQAEPKAVEQGLLAAAQQIITAAEPKAEQEQPKAEQQAEQAKPVKTAAERQAEYRDVYFTAENTKTGYPKKDYIPFKVAGKRFHISPSVASAIVSEDQKTVTINTSSKFFLNKEKQEFSLIAGYNRADLNYRVRVKAEQETEQKEEKAG